MKGIYIILLMVLFTAFFVLDNQLYRYGQSTFLFYRLPMNIKVHHRHNFEGGSFIEDDDPIGMPLFNVGYEQQDKNGSLF